jgi:hypothetical protein
MADFRNTKRRVSSREGSSKTRRSFYRLTITSQHADEAKKIVAGLLIQKM